MVAEAARPVWGIVVLLLLVNCVVLLSARAYDMPYSNVTRTLAIGAHGWCTVFLLVAALFATPLKSTNAIWALAVANVISSITDIAQPLIMTLVCVSCLLL